MGGTGEAAFLGPEAMISGTMSGQDLVVLGRFDGDLQLSGRLHAGKSSRMKATVRAAAVHLEGEFDGEIRAQTLFLEETARARGTFVAERLTMREGALLQGTVNLPAGASSGSALPQAALLPSGADPSSLPGTTPPA